MTTSIQDKEKSIFVQIASYRDPELINTLTSLISNAKNPENLNISICWQHGPEEELELFNSLNIISKESSKTKPEVGEFTKWTLVTEKNTKLLITDVHFHKAKGACWARWALQQEYSGEKYTMQLDSHHRFVEQWDELLIDMLEGLRGESDKPVLTAYLPSYQPNNDPAGRVKEPWKMNFDRFIPEGAVFFIPSTIDDWKERAGKPMRARFYSGHFAFADGSFAVEVQHDPEYFFHGEEISIAARAYTYGYDLYHPTVLVAWHEYTRKGRVKVWDDHTTQQKNKKRIDLDWVERNNLCHRRNRILFGMDGEDPTQIDFGKYGFGQSRTLLQYEEYSGLSFKYRGVQQETLDHVEPPNTTKYVSEEQWKSTFTRSNDIRVLIHRNELGELQDDYDFWFVGCHDADGNEIFRKDAQVHEIKRYVENEWIDFRLIFLSNKKPATYSIWPHSTKKGWGQKIDKQVTEH